MRLYGRVLARAIGAVSGVLGLGCSRTDPGEFLVFDVGASDGGGERDAGPREAGRERSHPDASGGEGGKRDHEVPDASHDGPRVECVSDPACDDRVACTLDTCDTATGMCVHTPLDTSCSSGAACFAAIGCAPGAYAESHETLFSVVLPAAYVTLLGTTASNKFDDIALSPDGTLYAVTAGELYTVTPEGYATPVAPVDRELEGLDFDDDGVLYGAGSTGLYTVDPSTGALTPLAEFPTGMGGEVYSASGDVAVLGTTLFATATSGGSDPDILVSVDLSGPTPTVVTVGSTGRNCVWGLAAREGVLYGFTCDGDVVSIDPKTAAVTLVASYPGDTFYGASAR